MSAMVARPECRRGRKELWIIAFLWKPPNGAVRIVNANIISRVTAGSKSRHEPAASSPRWNFALCLMTSWPKASLRSIFHGRLGGAAGFSAVPHSS
jgi:hypothetical protein